MRNDISVFDPDDYEPDTARILVAEAFHTFGELVALQMADLLDVPIAECAEDIERLGHRLQ